jgi:lipoyl synthase
MQSTSKRVGQKPEWLKRPLPVRRAYESTRALLRGTGVHTVCEEARCPNQWDCFSQTTATFLIMGPGCTRACRFCAVTHDARPVPDLSEPAKVAETALRMGLHHVVITSVTRDDLADGGASLFARTIEEVRVRMPQATVEVLIPDFQGNRLALQRVLAAHPDVMGHNIETVPRLYPSVRPGADYARSLDILRIARTGDSSLPVKSGLMVGLGESSEEIRQTLHDLREAGCTILTLGQYLQPSTSHLPVNRYVSPEEFDKWRTTALEIGLSAVASAPLVRSSYQASHLYRAACIVEG